MSEHNNIEQPGKWKLPTELTFQLIFKSFPDAVILSRFSDGMLMEMNPGFSSLTGYAYHEAIHRTTLEIGLYPDPADREDLLKLLSQGSLTDKKYKFCRKNGEVFDVLLSASCLKMHEETYLLSVFKDVSEVSILNRKLERINKALGASNQIYLAFLEHSPDGVALTDEKGLMREWNRSMVEFTGISSKEAIGKKLIDILFMLDKYNVGKKEEEKDIRRRFEDYFRGKIDSFKADRSEKVLMEDEKGVKYLQSYIFPVKTNQGNRIAMITRNVTELRDIQQSTELYREIYRNTENGIAILDLEGRYIEQNDAHQQILGFSMQDLRGKSPEVFLGKRIFYEIFKVFDYQKAFEGELKAINYHGKKIFIDLILFPVYFESEQGFIVSIVRDITRQKHNEEELIKSKRKAEEADRLKTAFLANMSHEIRTPMNAILGFSSLLGKSDVVREQKRKYIDIINRNGETLLHLIDDIIDIAKIESNQLKINMNPCNLTDLLQDVYESMKEVMHREEKNNVELFLKIQDKSLIIKTDCYRLRQILVNLIYNAIKFTHAGSISFGYEKKHESELYFFVKDTGEGITDSVMKNIFKRFTKNEQSDGKFYSGAGLGLSITQELIRMLGGKIWLESDPGKGTSFYFTLPLLPSIEDFREVKNNYKQNHNSSWESKKILIVEDDIYSVLLLSEFLNVKKAQHIHAANGNEALRIFRKNRDIDLIIMDIQLPGMNGYETTRQIKIIDPDIPIVAQSAFAMEEEKILALDSGCDEFISKPVSSREFFKVLGRYID